MLTCRIFTRDLAAFTCPRPSRIPASPELKLSFIDNYLDGPSPLQETGDAVRYAINVGDSLPLRICLAWTDLPARALQNNLNLFVEDPNGDKYLGNEDRLAAFRAPDPDNNVEIVRIENPVAGDYVIKVSLTNFLGTIGQHFALVVSGDLSSELTVW